MKDGRYVFEGDWRIFVPEELVGFYDEVKTGFEKAKASFRSHKKLSGSWKWMDNEREFAAEDPDIIAFELGGHCGDGNWANMGNFNIVSIGEYHDEQGDLAPEMRPVTEDGRAFEYIGGVPSNLYVLGQNDAKFYGTTMLLFFDPVSQIALTTFDWT